MLDPELNKPFAKSDTEDLPPVAVSFTTKTQKLRRMGAVALAVTGMFAGLVATPNTASAHHEHNASYTSGNHDACGGAAWPIAIRSDDFWRGHFAATAVELVRGSNCIRGTTDTWSDNYWTGFTNNVYIELYDSWGTMRWRSAAVSKLKFGVAGTNRSNHSRRDLYTFSLPPEVSQSVASIRITQLEGCCL